VRTDLFSIYWYFMKHVMYWRTKFVKEQMSFSIDEKLRLFIVVCLSNTFDIVLFQLIEIDGIFDNSINGTVI
jgi:hypothetical protein